ncbi:related to Probable NADPH:adrenodoxin oxidoreductase, mitochondrial [Saccharomycodes ludwigii]|uniref:NADPH:adrenodoxin oxidoreductase, mitochondrial n=1 Tax=Saccharomycodes ludwigii TaxID=36035 RepID=A0A376BAT5_9ASCO|nr:related to Probable NADPH:adrenodoxin oxidoreductase, mitochondrial [Saccharomycodes ludwigii]
MKSISIIGSGPSGFYTAYHLLKKSPIPLNITLWEKFPVPFGLSRYGVAPDHPEVKNCEETFTQFANAYTIPSGSNNLMHKFQFIGNVQIDSEKLFKLRSIQDCVILSYGCNNDKKLGIPGENDTLGVVSSRQFVNWYNSYPENACATPEQWKGSDFWKNVKNVAIIGNGNVALDICRVLLTSNIKQYWQNTDINQASTEAIKHVSNVKIIGRRGYEQSKFTNKEFRELWELEKYGIKGNIDSKYLSNVDESKLDRAGTRRLEMVKEYMKPFDQRTKKNYKKFKPPSTFTKFWEFDYMKTPVKINKDARNNRISSITLAINKVNEMNKFVIDNSKPCIDYPIDFLITSLGYKGVNIDELGCQKHLNNIKFAGDHLATNREGQVLSSMDNKPIPGLFASGWIKTGSKGVIVSTMIDSFTVGDEVIKYLQCSATSNQQASIIDLQNTVLDSTNYKPTTWFDWLKLDAYEKKLGNPRRKIINIADMLKIIGK